MRRRSLVVAPLALAFVVGGPLGLAGRAAFASDASQPEAVGAQPAGDSASVQGALPALMRTKSTKPVNVFVQLTGAPGVDTYLQQQNSGRFDASAISARIDQIKSEQAVTIDQARSYGQYIGQATNLLNGFALANVSPANLATLQTLPNVKSVTVMGTTKLDLQNSVPLIGGQAVATGPKHLTGQGTTIAELDTGIDYTSAGFGGPGTTGGIDSATGLTNAYEYAKSMLTAQSSDLPIMYSDGTHNAQLFPNQKVIGGYDFLGDQWPFGPIAPDANPLDPVGGGDTGGHGTHTSGIAAGYGITNNNPKPSLVGSTWMWGAKPLGYNLANPASFTKVFHGVAPNAKLYMYKVCADQVNSCETSTMVLAFDRAMDPQQLGNYSDHVDAINMSIGGPFAGDEVLQAAANKAVRAGVAVAISAGNSGNVPFILGAPSSASRALSVASSVAFGKLYKLQVSGVTSTIPMLAQDWGADITNSANWVTAPLKVAPGGSGADAGNGCNSFPAGTFTGKIALIVRGVCNVSVKASNAEAAGAVGTIIYDNRVEPLPSFSYGGGTINHITVSISQADGQMLVAGYNGASTTLDSTQVALDKVDTLSGFTSRGPSRFGNLKPDITAPGDSILSVQAGTGNGGVKMSGTSMAAPHIAGSLALMKQEHPTWTAQELEAVLVNTSNLGISFVNGITKIPASVSYMGAGRVSLVDASNADSVVLGGDLANVSFGYLSPTGTNQYTATGVLTVENKNTTTAKTYNLSYVQQNNPVSGMPNPGQVSLTFSQNNFTLSKQGTVGSKKTIDVTITVNAAALNAWGLSGSGLASATALDANELGGQIFVTDTTASKQYHVPYMALPRATSTVSATPTFARSGEVNTVSSLNLSNGSGITGGVQLFSLLTPDRVGDQNAPAFPGVWDGTRFVDGSTTNQLDIRYFGARMLYGSVLQFAVTTNAPITVPIATEFDIQLDTNNDGNADYVVFNADYGSFVLGSANGVNATFVYDINAGAINGPYYYTAQSVNSSNVIETVPLSALGMTNTSTFGAQVYSFSYIYGPSFDSFAVDYAPNNGWAVMNLGQPQFTPSTFATALGANTTVNVTTDTTAQHPTPSSGVAADSEAGVLALFMDNAAGNAEAMAWVPAVGLQGLARQYTSDAAGGHSLADQITQVETAEAGLPATQSTYNAAVNAFKSMVNSYVTRGWITPSDAAYLKNAITTV